MMNYILFDGPERIGLLPLTFTKPIAELRIGILTIKEKWLNLGFKGLSYITEPYLAEKYPLQLEEENCVINGAIMPTKEIMQEILTLEIGQRLVKDKQVVASKLRKEDIQNGNWGALESVDCQTNVFFFKRPYDIFHVNGKAISDDINVLKLTLSSSVKGEQNTILGKDLYIDESVEIDGVTINSKTGPVYIGKNVKILEGAIIRGPIAICNDAVVKVGAKLYGDTTIGPHCKVGGEISNVVFQGYSNKGHDGYLGNSVIGEWCNLGADTNSSNLKNNYGNIAIWNYTTQTMEPSDLQFCGLIMGDHAKTGINTMLNTGTVVGVAANVFGSGFPPKFIPSFSWGGFENNTRFQLDKAFEVADRVMSRRQIALGQTDKNILEHIFNMSAKVKS